MAKQKQEDPPKGSPAWMSTFSDLMNLLLCFFVLLFSMSSVDEEKFEEVVASLQSAMSILPAGGSAIGDGQLVSAGVRQLEFLDSYYSQMANSSAQDEDVDNTGGDSDEGDSSGSNKEDMTAEQAEEAYDEAGKEESEKMAEQITDALDEYGLQDMVEVDFNAEYVQLSLSGAILFESGDASLLADAYPVVDKIGLIISTYTENLIEVEGHTDNVPLTSSKKYEDNDVLSMYRALTVADYLRDTTEIEDGHIMSAGRGDYDPVADNSTAEGRARNRRVEIKIYNTLNSDF